MSKSWGETSRGGECPGDRIVGMIVPAAFVEYT